jgi:hypothetical protein
MHESGISGSCVSVVNKREIPRVFFVIRTKTNGGRYTWPEMASQVPSPRLPALMGTSLRGIISILERGKGKSCVFPPFPRRGC